MLNPRNGIALDWECGDAHEALRTELPSQPGPDARPPGAQLADRSLPGRRGRAELTYDPGAITDRSQPALVSGRRDHSTRSTEIGELSKFKSINISEQQQREPPVGIEPTTCSLRETRAAAPHELAAQVAQPNHTLHTMHRLSAGTGPRPVPRTGPRTEPTTSVAKSNQEQGHAGIHAPLPGRPSTASRSRSLTRCSRTACRQRPVV